MQLSSVKLNIIYDNFILLQRNLKSYLQCI